MTPPNAVSAAADAGAAVRVYSRAAFWRKLIAASGPGYLIAVGYMDPGNWATDIAAGSRFGYALLPMVVFSNLLALFLQMLALKLGVASGKDLAQLCRAQFPRHFSIFLWLTAEIGIIACDLAEVVGTAIALKLLFGIPLLGGIVLTMVGTLFLLQAQSRVLQALVMALIAIIAGCFAYEIILAQPSIVRLLEAFVPSRETPITPTAIFLALGILGATVMPHNLYLHSHIARHNGGGLERREAFRFSRIDCILALSFAAAINAAILITAATAFHWSGHAEVVSIEDSYRLLVPTLGAGAAAFFAIALLAAGQNSTITGTMAGQIVMEGFLGIKSNPQLRRFATRILAIVPSFAVIAIAGEGAVTKLLLLSQVILSLQLGFAIFPLIAFTSRSDIVGDFANKRWTRTLGYTLGTAIMGANLYLAKAVFF